MGMNREQAINYLFYSGFSKEQINTIEQAFKQEPTTKNDLVAIHAEGLDEGIRCAMCTNSMANDLGCDGGCVVNKSMYKKVMDVIERRIADLPSVTPQEPRWIPVKFRPLTDEEQNKYPDYCYMADCPMPDDGEEILVCTVYGTVEKDECGFDDGFYLDSGYDWQTDIVAWMPLPAPFDSQESEDKE